LNITKTFFRNKINYTIEIDKNYASLIEQYLDALQHAAETKGKERHANGLPFEDQKICRINRDVGLGYGLGQIIKKAEEVVKLPPNRGILECCGIINYAAGVMKVLKEKIENTCECLPGAFFCECNNKEELK